MGLPVGWVTNPSHELTPNQQITALGTAYSRCKRSPPSKRAFRPVRQATNALTVGAYAGVLIRRVDEPVRKRLGSVSERGVGFGEEAKAIGEASTMTSCGDRAAGQEVFSLVRLL